MFIARLKAVRGLLLHFADPRRVVQVVYVRVKLAFFHWKVRKRHTGGIKLDSVLFTKCKQYDYVRADLDMRGYCGCVFEQAGRELIRVTSRYTLDF